jgi:dTDP-4-amino-4,6-dideoxygalactose transaminase
MPNINAALGCAQLEQLPKFLQAKKRLFSQYSEVFKAIPEVHLMSESKGCISNYWLHTILIKESSEKLQADILENAAIVGLGLRPPWVLMHKLKPYRLMPKSTMEVAESVAVSAINLPSGSSLC